MGGTINQVRRLILVALFACVAAVLIASPALALENATLTLNKETGGQPTRFTFAAQTDLDARVSSVRFTFPEGFELDEAEPKVVLLDGLKRIPVDPSVAVDGSELELGFSPAIPPGSTLRVEIYDVMTPGVGKDYELDVEYSAATSDAADSPRQAGPLAFTYTTASSGERIARWLDQQEGVTRFNSVKALGMFFKPQIIATAVPALFKGWLISIALVALAFPIAILFGLLLAFMRMSKMRLLRGLGGIYISVIRGTPLFLQIFIAFIGLRMAGIRAPDFATGVAVLAANSAAYLAEIFRAGIQSIHRGQYEAASSLGMTYWQAMVWVVIPQTVKRVLPTMTSEFILLFKDTSLLAAVGVFELMMGAQNISSRTGNLTSFMVAAAYYLIVTIPLIGLVGRLEARLAVSEGGGAASDNAGSGKPGTWHPDTTGGATELAATSVRHESR